MLPPASSGSGGHKDPHPRVVRGQWALRMGSAPTRRRPLSRGRGADPACRGSLVVLGWRGCHLARPGGPGPAEGSALLRCVVGHVSQTRCPPQPSWRRCALGRRGGRAVLREPQSGPWFPGSPVSCPHTSPWRWPRPSQAVCPGPGVLEKPRGTLAQPFPRGGHVFPDQPLTDFPTWSPLSLAVFRLGSHVAGAA